MPVLDAEKFTWTAKRTQVAELIKQGISHSNIVSTLHVSGNTVKRVALHMGTFPPPPSFPGNKPPVDSDVELCQWIINQRAKLKEFQEKEAWAANPARIKVFHNLLQLNNGLVQTFWEVNSAREYEGKEKLASPTVLLG